MSTQNLALQILGIDAAVDPRNTGYAIATSETGKWRIDALSTGTRTTDLADQITAKLHIGRPILLAIDSPLDWPRTLSESLARHRAGEPLDANPTTAFARETDRFVREKTALKPLDVGADRIARTVATSRRAFPDRASVSRIRLDAAVAFVDRRPTQGLSRDALISLPTQTSAFPGPCILFQRAIQPKPVSNCADITKMTKQTFRFTKNDVYGHRPAPPSLATGAHRALQDWESIAEGRRFDEVGVEDDSYIAQLDWAKDDKDALKDLTDTLAKNRLLGDRIE